MKSLNKYYNPHPLKKEIDDCVIRACCAINNDSWDDIYSELFEIGFKIKQLPNSVETLEHWLNKRGFKRMKISVAKGGKRPTVNDMAKRSKNEGVIVCRCASHIVTCKDGYSLDTWDSSGKSLYTYWIKEMLK